MIPAKSEAMNERSRAPLVKRSETWNPRGGLGRTRVPRTRSGIDCPPQKAMERGISARTAIPADHSTKTQSCELLVIPVILPAAIKGTSRIRRFRARHLRKEAL